MKILVTGGYGFIGSHFIKHILEKYPSYLIINIDNLSYAANLSNLKEVECSNRYSFVKGSICDFELVSNVVNDCDYVVNFAAQSHVDRSFNNEDLFYDTNTKGVLNILKALKNTSVKKFLQISTDEVYGENMSNIPHAENSSLCPTNPYSASKAAAEMFCLSYYKTYSIPVVISRSSNNFGLNQNSEKFIPYCINTLLSGKKIGLYGNGKQQRDWLNVKDNIRALDLILHSGKSGEIYNVSANNLIENIEIAKKIIKIMNLSPDRIEYVADRISHDRRYYIDSTKICNELGFSIKTDFEYELEKLVRSYLK